MSFHDDPVLLLYLLGAVLIIGYLVRMSLQARKGAPKEVEEEAMESAGGDLLLKFVVDADGTRRGETVAVDGQRLIVKDGPVFFSAPLDAFEARGEDVAVTGPVDWEAAKVEGEAWRERNHKVITYTEAELPKDDEA
jgi:hypothetical protein